MKAPQKKESFGTSSFVKLSPPRGKLDSNTPILNVYIPFEEALKLGLSIQQCLLQLNSYKRSTTLGKNMGLNVAIHLDQGKVTVHEGKL